MARCISLTSSEEYLCGVYYCDGHHRDYTIYRWNLTGLHGVAEPETTYFRLPAVDTDLCVGAFALTGSKIYMIGGTYVGSTRRSTDIFVVDTEKLRTQDAAQIVRKIPSVLQSVLSRRNAVAIGGKFYTFPVDFRSAALEIRGFRSGDGDYNMLLPEPDFLEYGIHEYYIALKSHILLYSGRSGEGYLFAFDTVYPGSGWRDVTDDVVTNSIGIHTNPLPLIRTHLKREIATALGGRDDDGSRVFGSLGGGSFYHGIVKFGDEPLRIGKTYRIYGIPKEMVGKACFAHGGSVFFTYLEDERPRKTRVWIFKKFSLFHHSVEEEYYSAQEVFSFQVKHPCTYDYDGLSSFVIPCST